MLTKIRKAIAGILNKGRLLHYLDIFIAASVVDLGANQQHILGAHGLNAAKSIAAGAAIAGVKALIEAYRKANKPKLLNAEAIAALDTITKP